MADYQLTALGVRRALDGAQIPNDARNADWRAYLKWVALGNMADAADPAPMPLTPHQVAQALFTDANDINAICWRGLIQLLANKFGQTPGQVLNAIVNAAN